MYNTTLQQLARNYAESFYNYIVGYNIEITVEDSYYLLEYAICCIYQIPCNWYTEGIRLYSESVIQYLNSAIIPNAYLTYEERIGLVSLSNSYLVAIVGSCV